MITNAVKVIRRIQEDPELSAFAETQAAIWQDAIKEAVIEERERCAKIADVEAKECGDCYFCQINHAKTIAIKIRKDRGCDPPQAGPK